MLLLYDYLLYYWLYCKYALYKPKFKNWIVCYMYRVFFYLDPTSTWHPTFILHPIFSTDPFTSSQDYALSNEVSIIIS